MGYLDNTGLSKVFTKLKALIDKKSDKGHTHNYSVPVTTAGTGDAYTATVDGITSLVVGTTLTIVPHVVSTAVSPTLNVNGLGAKVLRRRATNGTGTTSSGYIASWLAASKPIQVTYDGTYWIVDLQKPNALDLFGAVEIAHGGTGATTVAGAKTNLGLNNVDNIADSDKSVKYAISAGTANNVTNGGAATANAARHVWFSGSETETTRVYSDNFKYNPSTQMLTTNISGNAATATKLATVRTISLNGYNTGSVSFDGSANVGMTTQTYGVVKYVTMDTSTAPYFRICSFETTESWTDASVLCAIDSGYLYGGYGIVRFVFRSNHISTAGQTTAYVEWLARSGFAANQLIAKVNAPAEGKQYADIYFKAAGTYNACNIRVLTQGNRGNSYRTWTFTDGSTEATRANPDIRTYTATYDGYDAGITSGANNITVGTATPSSTGTAGTIYIQYS